MEASTENVIRRLQANFPEADTEAGRQIISEEVMRFIREGCSGEDQDIDSLEQAIRNRLASRTGTSGRAERLSAKKSLFSNDDWARISSYMAFMEREDERRRAADARALKRETRELLAGQVAQAQQKKLAEREEKRAELAGVSREVRQWERDEREKRARRERDVQRLRDDRALQLEEQANRRAAAAELRRRGEEEAAVRVAQELRKQMETEAGQRAKAKEDLKAFLLSNEVNKKIKEEQAERERQEDVRYMRQQEAQLDRQERERQQLLERVRAVQNRQAEDAAQRLPVKRWVAEEVIEKQFREKQAALAQEEARRKAAVTSAAARLRCDIEAQQREKEAARLAELQSKREELVGLMADLEVCKKTEAAAKATELAGMRAFKEQLDAQIADNQARRGVVCMTQTERKLNAKLLREVDAAMAGAKGTIPAVRSPRPEPSLLTAL